MPCWRRVDRVSGTPGAEGSIFCCWRLTRVERPELESPRSLCPEPAPPGLSLSRIDRSSSTNRVDDEPEEYRLPDGLVPEPASIVIPLMLPALVVGVLPAELSGAAGRIMLPLCGWKYIPVGRPSGLWSTTPDDADEPIFTVLGAK